MSRHFGAVRQLSPAPFASRRTPFWLRVVQAVGVTVSVLSLLTIYLPDTEFFGRYFYPYAYQVEIEREAKVFGLDPLFVAAVIRQESGFRPDARSAVGAIGLMQLMPATGRWAAERVGLKHYREAQLTDPGTNIRLGCWYLAYLFQSFKDPAKVLAAYNGGEGNVKFWGTLQGEHLAWAYPETQLYVSQTQRAYKRYQDLYGAERPHKLVRTMPMLNLPVGSPKPTASKPGVANAGASPRPASASAAATPSSAKSASSKPTTKPTVKPSNKPPASPRPTGSGH